MSRFVWSRAGRGRSVWWLGALVVLGVLGVLLPRLAAAQSVAWYSQNDAKWKSNKLGTCSGLTIGSHGCVVTCMAMLHTAETGVASGVDPGALNTWMTNNGGYAEGCLTDWAKAAAYDGAGGLVYVGSSGTWNDWAYLDAQLAAGRMVVVKVDFTPTTADIAEHWVVVTGRTGPSGVPSSYPINDPYPTTYVARTLQHYYDSTYKNTFFAARSFGGTFGSSGTCPTADGTLIKKTSTAAIYYMLRGKRWWIQNETHFNALGLSFSNVCEMADSKVDLIPLGPTIGANGTTFKTTSEVTVWKVENGQRKKFDLEWVFKDCYGPSFDDVFDKATTAFRNLFPEGSKMAYDCQPGSKESQSCGSCGEGSKSRTCSSACTWGSFGSCANQGVCSPGQTETQSCGACGEGSQTRTCSSSTCQWGSFGSCANQGVCSPGQTETQSCGACGEGSKVRTCSSSTCQWGSFGSCANQGVCSPGQQETLACGLCGEGLMSRTCKSDSCTWGSYGACGGTGPCAPGTTEYSACGTCGEGQKSRTCDYATCDWGGWGTCGGAGVCAPGEVQKEACGACGEGTRSRVCQAGTCGWGAWGLCETGATCSPGESETQSCGDCGMRTRQCSADSCTWAAWGACSGEGVCSPGETEKGSCGDCGSRVRACSGACAWQEWSACSGQCNDGDACNGVETCAGGVCLAGSPPVCDDGNACNGVETCNPASGCKAGKPLVCDDGNACNGVETCAPALGCLAGSPVACPANLPCNPATGTCAVCVPDCAGKACGGDGCGGSCGTCAGDPCAPAACQAGQCVSLPVDCSDGNPCTTDGCDPKTGACTHDALVCDDNDVCTKDVCAGGLCQSVWSGACTCTVDADCPNDGDLCNGSLQCKAGQCVTDPATVVTCAGGTSCAPQTGLCTCTPSCAGKACGDDGCGGSCGACSGSPCATSACVEGQCLTAPLVCGDGNPCTDDACDPAAGCVHTPTKCDDGDPCTVGVCEGATGACVHLPKGCACTSAADCGADLCGDSQECIDHVCVPVSGSAVVCLAGTVCDPASGACVGCVPQCDGTCGDDGCGGSCGVCNDGDPCTDDGCVAGACAFTPKACEDGNPCTDDACAGGVCTSAPRTCDDGVPCTLDLCDGVTGACSNLAMECGCATDGDCEDDGDLCNGTPLCVEGTCVAGPGVTCAAGTCDPETGACVVCNPACSGRECGDDGCGGSCGTCEGACEDGRCVSSCVCAAGGVPVCGAGVTWESACHAACAGAPVSHTGPCIVGATDSDATLGPTGGLTVGVPADGSADGGCNAGGPLASVWALLLFLVLGLTPRRR